MTTSAHSQEPVAPLTVTSHYTGRTQVLTVSGEIDMLTAPRLEKALTEALDEHPDAVVLDTTDVSFLSSAGLAVMVRIHQLAEEDVSFRVVASGAATLRPIELMGLDDELSIYASAAEAVAASPGE